MHELAIAESVVSTVLERTSGRVRVVRLRIGRMSGVVPDALMFLPRERDARDRGRGGARALSRLWQ